PFVPDDLGPDPPGELGRSIGRSVVDDNHRRQTRSHFLDERFDGRGLVQARNHGGASRWQIHRQTLVSRPRPGQDKFLPASIAARASSRIVASAVAAEVTRRNCFSRRNPPPHVGGYHFWTHPAIAAEIGLRSLPIQS